MRLILFPLVTLFLNLPTLAAAETIKATASFSILGDIVERVGRDLVDVSSIVGPDSDAHTYIPTVGDARAVAKADIVFINGLGFEGWVGDLIAASGNDARVITVTRDIEPLLVEGEADPHAWNDMSNGVTYARAVMEGLSALDPDNAATYAANQQAFANDIAALLSSAQERFAALPENQRSVVTAHDAFGYFEAQFGLRFLAPVGMNTEAEPSARELAGLIRQIKDEGIGGLFVENITNPDLVAQIAKETGLEIGGRLYSDALSAQGGPATSYLAMMEHNIATLLSTLSR
jgi:zinc/manganese transport system substrate-binding protein